MIVIIKDTNEIWWKKEEDIERTFRTYFNELFTSARTKSAEDICEVVRNRIFDEDHEWCSCSFDSVDIKETLK